MRKHFLIPTALVLLASSVGLTYFAVTGAGSSMTSAAQTLVETFDAEQRKTAMLEYDSPDRVGWHFIPKDYRKGLQLKHMSEEQREKTHALLKVALSEMGYRKSAQIMELEKVLEEFEKGQGRWARDHLRYYVTFFGTPGPDSKWGLSFEGHHLSLNFVVDQGKLISTTPQFFAANPAEIKNENAAGFEVGSRVLAKEELLAFELVQSLNDDQREVAVLAAEAPSEIRDAGSAQPPVSEPEGIAYRHLNIDQKNLLLNLIEEYANAMPQEIGKARIDKLHYDGLNAIHFAWAGATEPGIGHYYRVQGPSFLIEFVNTQPDAAGNPANHIHCVWRDMHGDFAIPIKNP